MLEDQMSDERPEPSASASGMIADFSERARRIRRPAHPRVLHFRGEEGREVLQAASRCFICATRRFCSEDCEKNFALVERSFLARGLASPRVTSRTSVLLIVITARLCGRGFSFSFAFTRHAATRLWGGGEAVGGRRAYTARARQRA